MKIRNKLLLGLITGNIKKEHLGTHVKGIGNTAAVLNKIKTFTGDNIIKTDTNKFLSNVASKMIPETHRIKIDKKDIIDKYKYNLGNKLDINT